MNTQMAFVEGVPIVSSSGLLDSCDMKKTMDVLESWFLQLGSDQERILTRLSPKPPCENLVFTIGEYVREDDRYQGFRVYHSKTPDLNRASQATVIFSDSGAKLEGIVIGNLLGEWRTGAIGGIAVRYMVPEDSKILAVIGTGRQALTQAIAAVESYRFKEIRVCSRLDSSAAEFEKKIRPWVGASTSVAQTCSVERAVEQADVIITATSAKSIILKEEWLKPTCHINHVGSKDRNESEIDPNIYNSATRVVTDSLPQFYENLSKSIFGLGVTSCSVKSLSSLIENGGARESGRSVFVSYGAAGSEMVVAKMLLENMMIEK